MNSLFYTKLKVFPCTKYDKNKKQFKVHYKLKPNKKIRFHFQSHNNKKSKTTKANILLVDKLDFNNLNSSCNFTFTALTYTQSLNTLMKFANTKKQDKVMYVFAGANGSGKSTLIANLYAINALDGAYINADIIKYLTNKSDFECMELTTQKLDYFIKQGYKIVYETVFSHESKIDILKQALENGYKVNFIQVFTNSPEINIQRVSKRVQQGGHNVPADKIVSRYYRTLNNIEKAKQLPVSFYFFDNSK